MELLKTYVQELSEKNRIEREKIEMQRHDEILRISYSNISSIIVETLCDMGLPLMLDEVADQCLFTWATDSMFHFNFKVATSIDKNLFKKRFAQKLALYGFNPSLYRIKFVGTMLKMETL